MPDDSKAVEIVTNSPRSRALFKRAGRVMPSGYTRDLVRTDPHPFYAATADGCWITDVDGNRCIDWVNNFTAMIHGHNRREVIDVVTSQAGRLMSAVLPTEWEVRLAELLVDRLPGVDWVRFANSGTEANQVITKVARAFTGKTKMAKMEGGYHGQFDLLEASFQPEPDAWGPERAPVPVAHNIGTPQSLLDELVVLPFNDIEATRAILRREADNLAGVIIDPFRLHQALVEPEPAFLLALREETERLGILLIFDEVVSLRLGYAGAQGVRGVVPDLTTLGKIIGGGLPIGAIGGRRDIMQVFDFGRGERKVKHSGTFTGNPMSMATGFTSMSLLTPEAFADLEAKGERLREGLRRLHRDHRLPGRVSGEASMTTLILTDGPLRNYRDIWRAKREGMTALMDRFAEELGKEGVFVMRGAFVGSTPMTNEDIDFTLAAASRAMSRLSN